LLFYGCTVATQCRAAEAALGASINAKNADDLSAALKRVDALRLSAAAAATASQLLIQIGGETEARVVMAGALATGTVDALRRALSAAQAMNISTDPKAIECEQMLAKLLEQDRLRAVLLKALAARDEAEVTVTLERAASAGLSDSDDSVQRARAWLKQVAAARKRLQQLIAAQSADGLPAAIASALELGLEFDRSVGEAQSALKQWADTSAALRAAIDMHPVITLAALDAAVTEAAKARLSEQTPNFAEALKGIRSKSTVAAESLRLTCFDDCSSRAVPRGRAVTEQRHRRAQSRRSEWSFEAGGLAPLR
jgi:hypothetical protein